DAFGLVDVEELLGFHRLGEPLRVDLLQHVRGRELRHRRVASFLAMSVARRCCLLGRARHVYALSRCKAGYPLCGPSIAGEFATPSAALTASCDCGRAGAGVVIIDIQLNGMNRVTNP